jgi:hypothetical protein
MTGRTASIDSLCFEAKVTEVGRLIDEAEIAGVNRGAWC